MAWNKDTYYYQNQMKVLSGTDPEPGYIEDETSEQPANLEQRIEGNGLYRFVSLIKNKLQQLKNISWSLINIDPTSKEKIDSSDHISDGDLNYLDGENKYNDNSDIGTKETIGNFYYGRDSYSARPQNHYPKYLNKNYSGKVKVSSGDGLGSRYPYAPGEEGANPGDTTQLWSARQDLLHNMNPNRYVRLHSGNGNSQDIGEVELEDNWTPWYVFVPMTEEEAHSIGLIDDNGQPTSWSEIFLRRKDDFTNGPIGFGVNPSGEEEDISKTLKAKIVLGDYTYGTELPSAHYANLDSNIPKGQIYLQYDPSAVERVLD